MSKYLVLTTDLPYFPGKNGHDFFNLRHLAEHHHVGLVAPLYESYPTQGVANLEQTVGATYLWPRPAAPQPLFAQGNREGELAPWLLRLPRWLKLKILRRLLGIEHDPDDAHERLAILANCAPQLLHALAQNHWQTVVLIQTSNRPWLDFLPRLGAKCVYFHDVRSDYLRRAHPPLPHSIVYKVRQQERKACTQADAVGFVSERDLSLARELLPLPLAAEVAPIPVDGSYFIPPPPGWQKPAGKTVLFTGHLGHPPNVDAIEFLLKEIWPKVVIGCPGVRLVVAGLQPDPRVVQAIANTPNAELHQNVPDIRPYFWNADVYVVPMRYGGGVRQKIIEAWSMQVPVVCTPMGAEGSGAIHERHGWLEQDAAAFARRVISLLHDRAPQPVLDAAAAAARRGHSIEVAGARFERLCDTTQRVRRHQKFRLLYDLRWMEIGRSGGTEQMTHELLNAISRLDHRNQYTAYVPRSTFNEWNLDPAFNLRPVFCDEGMLRRERVVSRLTNRLAETEGRLPVLTPEMRTLRAYHRLDFDLAHATCGYVHPDLSQFPQILTVHDLQHVAHPQFFGRQEWQERDRLYRNSVNRALHVIAISEYTRQHLHRHYGTPLEKITTIWNIPSRHVWTPLDDASRRRVLATLGLADPFLFFPAHDWPHKNHARLVEAFALVLPDLPRHLRLVFTGRPFPADHPVRQLMQQPRLQGRVLHLGYRSPLEMKAMFYGCELLVFPSLFEGFGMPVAEAIIAGKPVICSNTTSLPEIAGDAAHTFDPEDVRAIGASLLLCLNDPAYRASLTAAAARRKAVFSARTSAVKTLALYRRIFDSIYG